MNLDTEGAYFDRNRRDELDTGRINRLVYKDKSENVNIQQGRTCYGQRGEIIHIERKDAIYTKKMNLIKTEEIN